MKRKTGVFSRESSKVLKWKKQGCLTLSWASRLGNAYTRTTDSPAGGGSTGQESGKHKVLYKCLFCK